MENAIYASLTRQSGLMKEMRVVANNIANANTTGYRREGVIFAENLSALDRNGDTLSMADARGRMLDLKQGVLTQTNGNLDLIQLVSYIPIYQRLMLLRLVVDP